MASTTLYNIVLAGQFGVGKTTIFKYLHDNLLRLQEDMPVMADTVPSSSTASETSSRKWEKWRHKITCRDGATVEVILWDTSGMEEHGIVGMTRSYFANSIAAVLVYDIGETDTLNILRDWVDRSRWSDSVDIVLSLWGNDKGCTDTLVSEEGSAGFANHYDIPEELTFRVNAESGAGVAESYQKVVEAVHSQHSPNIKWTRFLGYSTSVDSGTFTHQTSMQSSHHIESLARPVPSTPPRVEPHVQQAGGAGQDVVRLHEHNEEPHEERPKDKSWCPKCR